MEYTYWVWDVRYTMAGEVFLYFRYSHLHERIIFQLSIYQIFWQFILTMSFECKQIHTHIYIYKQCACNLRAYTRWWNIVLSAYNQLYDKLTFKQQPCNKQQAILLKFRQEFSRISIWFAVSASSIYQISRLIFSWWAMKAFI